MSRVNNAEEAQQAVVKIYEEEHNKVKEVLSNLGSQISLSMDLLRYEKREEQHEYLCLSAHFIDDKWNLRKWVLHYGEVYGSDWKHPTRAASDSVKDWDIEGKVFSLTIGGEINTDLVKEQVHGRRELALDGQLFHVRCCSDMISQMVQNGFNMIDEIIDKAKFFGWSNSLPLWYLTSTKLRNALKLKGDGTFPGMPQEFLPSKEEWEKVKRVCKMVDQIYEITKGLFKAKMPTANLFLPHLHKIRTYLTQEATSSDVFVKSLAETMLKTLNKYWNEMYLMPAIAAFLDPRHKMELIESCFPNPGNGDDEKAAYVLQSIRRLYNGYVGPTEEPQNSDLDLYLTEPVMPLTENFCVLTWWKQNCSKYPLLSRMARDILGVPISVATSYEAYYAEPREADKTVLSLGPELMNALMCTRSWKLGYNKH
ncbi:zinc finger BED domain-containing protein RICESLEEPER 2-like [Silene latifolia]|uniref:zinc finger BED domain-containing protein RICESLEEPER 2-like n=1 Tax=Silene latifolia TaxID=37657 RepID=UPI003D784C78